MNSAYAAVRAKLHHSPLARRFLGGAAWSVLGAIVTSGLTLIMLMLLARLLGKEAYGQFVIIQSTLVMVGVFAGFGIGTATTRYAAELRERDVSRLGRIFALAERTVLVFGLIAAAGLTTAAEWLANNMLNSPGIGLPLALAASAVLFLALDGYQKSVLTGFESFRAYAIVTMVGTVLGFPVILLAASYFDLAGSAGAISASALVQAVVSRYQLNRELSKFKINPTANGCMQEWPVLWHFALPALLAGALLSPAHWAVQAMLAHTANGYAELAVLGIAMQWFNVIMFVPSTAGRVILPLLTDHITKNDYSGSRRILLYAMAANALVAVPLAMVVAVFSPFIMELYGNNFGADYAPLIIAASTAALLAIQTPVGNLLASLDRMWLGALMNSGWAAIYLCSAYLLLSEGALGVQIALGLGYLGHAIWTFWFAMRHISTKSAQQYKEKK
jgi:O-antigen/teichoic acid export membrane protein